MKDDADRRRSTRPRTHPAEVTADRLLNHVERWHDRSTGTQRDAVGVVRAWLQDIADGVR